MIEVVEYDPSWPERFARLRDRYLDAMTGAQVPVLAIEGPKGRRPAGRGDELRIGR